MATAKSFTDQTQGIALRKILSIESADMVYLYWIGVTPAGIKREGIEEVPTIKEELPIDSCDIPCWSLAALLSVLPPYQLQTQDDGIGILCSCNGKFIIVTANNPVDACYEMILKLHELKKL